MLCGVVINCFGVVFFFFKQKTAYEMRISDWSSDVCSSDLYRWYGMAYLAGEHSVRPNMDVVWELLKRSDLEGALALTREFDALAEIGRASCRERVCQYV